MSSVGFFDRMSSLQYSVGDLHYMTNSGDWDDIQRIIENQPQLVNEKYNGVASLHWIVLNSAPQDIIMKSLKLATTAVIEEVPIWDIQDRCILHMFAELGYTEALHYALDKISSQVNMQDQAGDSPLHWLMNINHAFSIHLEMTKAFLKAGADVLLENKDCLTPMDLYRGNTCGNYEISTKEEQKKQLLLLLRCAIPVSLNNEQLWLIAKGVGVDGKQLGIRLGLKWRRIQQIWTVSRHYPVCVIVMLQQWRVQQQQSGKINEALIVALALKEQGLTGLAEEIFGSQIFQDLPSTALRSEDQANHKHNGYLADRDLQFIAERLIDGKVLCIYLGRNDTELKKIQYDNASSIRDANLEMLVRWRDEKGNNENHLDIMRAALDLHKRGDIKEELEIYYCRTYY